jgi:ribosomal protein S8E
MGIVTNDGKLSYKRVTNFSNISDQSIIDKHLEQIAKCSSSPERYQYSHSNIIITSAIIVIPLLEII